MPHNRLIGVALFIIATLLILGIIRLRRRQRQKSDKNNPILQRAREHLQAVRGAPFQAKPLANRLEKAAYQTAVDIVQNAVATNKSSCKSASAKSCKAKTVVPIGR